MKQQKATYTQLYQEVSRRFSYDERHTPIIRYTLERWQTKGAAVAVYIVRKANRIWDSGFEDMTTACETATVHDFRDDEQALRWIVRHTEREFAELNGYEPQDETEDEGDA